MILILVASVALGLGGAGVVLLLFKLTGKTAPRYAAPIAAGLSMASFMLWNEYTWFDRAQAALPDGAKIAETYEHASWVQPWTLAVPRVTRFAAVTLEPPGALRWGWVTLAARFEGSQRIPVVFDCAAGRRAALSEAAQARLESGSPPAPADLDWVEVGTRDPLLAAACGTQAG
ncbi:MAG: hypothetical protein AAF899_01020 [Pseudomonadota bacterium]